MLTMRLPFYQTLHKFDDGFLLSKLLRDRGRSRKFVSDGITQSMRSKLSRLRNGSLNLPTSGNASCPPISLTSWHRRFDSLPLVLLNLLEQDLLPARILVWLAEDDYDLFDPTLRCLFENSIVEFCKTQDFGPHKKWLPLALSSDRPFVVCDDDIFYAYNWYRSLVEADDKKNCIAHRCHRLKLSNSGAVSPYENWAKDIGRSDSPSHSLFAVGCGGVLIYPDRISTRFRDWDNIAQVCPRGDDIWLKLAHLDSNTPVKKTLYMSPFIEYRDSQTVGLSQSNVNLQQNDIQIKDSIENLQLDLHSLAL